ncbi:MAG: hypothetical protein IJP53_01600, partial [Synergistaceae bacterium]|nr:hypothetical protein [Synergistaceae bacterium]
DIALVSDDEVASAILALIEKQKMIAEGAGAVSVAAAMFNKFNLRGKRKIRGEFALFAFGYNLARVENLLGFGRLMKLVRG